MIYFLIAALILLGIIKYDIRCNITGEKTYYKFIYLVLVLISGLAYRVGTDIVSYEYEFYNDYKDNLINILSSFTLIGNRQPGWVLTQLFFYKVFHNFLIFKIVHAAFLQYAVFWFVKKYSCNSKYTTLLFYFIFIYLQLNLNVLRESVAVAFFLFSIPYLINKDYLRYYLWAFLALMFHMSALVLFILPIVCLFRIKSWKSFLIISITFGILTIVLQSLNLNEIFLNLSSMLPMDNENVVAEGAELYLNSNKYQQEKSSFIRIFVFVIMTIIPALYCLKNKIKVSDTLIPLSFMYTIFFILNEFIPIFYRFNSYFTIIYYLFVGLFIINFTRFNTIGPRLIVCLVLFAIYLYPIRSYFGVNPFYGQPMYVQYYPYHSVITKQKSETRENSIYIYKKE